MFDQYLSPTKRESGLTRELSSLVRQQRHLGMRVIISTQGTKIYSTIVSYISLITQ